MGAPWRMEEGRIVCVHSSSTIEMQLSKKGDSNKAEEEKVPCQEPKRAGRAKEQKKPRLKTNEVVEVARDKGHPGDAGCSANEMEVDGDFDVKDEGPSLHEDESQDDSNSERDASHTKEEGDRTEEKTCHLHPRTTFGC